MKICHLEEATEGPTLRTPACRTTMILVDSLGLRTTVDLIMTLLRILLTALVVRRGMARHTLLSESRDVHMPVSYCFANYQTAIIRLITTASVVVHHHPTIALMLHAHHHTRVPPVPLITSHMGVIGMCLEEAVSREDQCLVVDLTEDPPATRAAGSRTVVQLPHDDGSLMMKRHAE
jgi:hypothetical protein